MAEETPSVKEQQLLKEIELLKLAASVKNDIAAKDKEAIFNAQVHLRNLREQNLEAQRHLETLNQRIAAENDEDAKERLGKQLNNLRERLTLGEKYKTQINQVLNLNLKHLKLQEAMAKMAKESQKKIDDNLRTTERAERRKRKEFAITRERFVAVGQDVVTATIGITEAMGKVALDTITSQESAFVNFASRFGVANDAAVAGLSQAMSAMPTQMDTNFRSIVKNTGLFSQEMKSVFVTAIDPGELLAEGISTMEPLLRNIGITAKESGEALKGLINNVSMFRPAYIEANRGTASYVTNLVAGLTKMGVTGETSTKIIEQQTKVFKKTPTEAAKTTKKLLKLADSLGVSAGRVAKEFAEMTPELAMFGDDMTDVFANLQAQSVATGLSVSKLGKFAEGLDTFKGAAKAAQGLNAVLGGTFVSVTDLVHAPFDEKIVMIQEAMDRANVSFAEAPRRMKQVIAAQLGMNVADAAQYLGGKDEFEEVAAGMDTTAMSQEEISQKIKSTMTNAEMLKSTMSSLGGGMNKFVDRTRIAAVQGAARMTMAMAKLQKQTKDTEIIALGTVGAYNAANAALSTGVGTVATLVGTVFGRDATDEEEAAAGLRRRAPGSGAGGTRAAAGGASEMRELIDAIKSHKTPVTINVKPGEATQMNINTWTKTAEEVMKLGSGGP